MKILMLTPYLPYPPSSGGQVRSYNLIKNLGKKHKITLFSLIKDDSEKQYTAKLSQFCSEVAVFKRPEKPWTLQNIVRTGLSLYPFLVIRNFSKEAKGAIAETVKNEKFDLIHAETFYVMPHIPRTETPILLVEQTIEYQVYQHYADKFPILLMKPILYIDVFKLRFWEAKFWREAAKVVAVSEADREKMLSLVPELSVEIVPNGAGEDLVDLWKERGPGRESPIIFYQGNFNWLQNTEAAEILVKKVFPLIKKEIPNARCWIVGQGVEEKIGNLAGNGVEIHELGPSDIKGVRNAYREATVFLAPLAGPGGTRLKILAAMAAGVPVVTTSTGISGIEAEDGKEVWVRDNSEEMAQAAIGLIKNQALYSKTTKAARKLFEEKYNWEKLAAKLDQVYREVARGKD